jgi:ubiquinone/menaquinone biosynthesis C-methylase UbiE
MFYSSFTLLESVLIYSLFSAIEAQDKLRYSFLDAVSEYLNKNKLKKPKKAIDIGCSVGISTFYLSQYFDSMTNVDGLDLSPYFLSVALARQNRVISGVANSEFSQVDDILLSKFTSATAKKIKWIYANAENTGLATNAYDLTAISFMFHELPSDAR